MWSCQDTSWHNLNSLMFATCSINQLLPFVTFSLASSKLLYTSNKLWPPYESQERVNGRSSWQWLVLLLPHPSTTLTFLLILLQWKRCTKSKYQRIWPYSCAVDVFFQTSSGGCKHKTVLKDDPIQTINLQFQNVKLWAVLHQYIKSYIEPPCICK